MFLSYEQGVSHLRLRDLYLRTLLPQCGLLFRYNRFIQTLTFDRIDFTDASPVFRQMFERAHSFKPFELIFQSCDLCRASFTSFFEALSKVDRQMTSLTFRNCTFSEPVFRSVVQVIFFEHCFHALESFAIEGTTLGCLSQCILEFTCCSWAMELKCLASITVANCGIDGVEFISQFLQFDIGLRELNLEGSSLSRPIPAMSQVSVKKLDFLGLKSCRTVSLDFLLSLLALIEEHSVIMLSSDLNDPFTVFSESGTTGFIHFVGAQILQQKWKRVSEPPQPAQITDLLFQFSPTFSHSRSFARCASSRARPRCFTAVTQSADSANAVCEKARGPPVAGNEGERLRAPFNATVNRTSLDRHKRRPNHNFNEPTEVSLCP
jgi:hypothetical protein